MLRFITPAAVLAIPYVALTMHHMVLAVLMGISRLGVAIKPVRSIDEKSFFVAVLVKVNYYFNAVGYDGNAG